MIGLGFPEIIILLFVVGWSVGYLNRRKATEPVAENVHAARKPSVRFPVMALTRSLASCLLAPTMVMGIFVVLSGAANSPLLRLNSSVWQAPAPVTATYVAHAETVPEKTAQIEGTRVETTQPKWTTESDTTIGDVRTFVFSSRLWSSSSEAEHELQSKVAQIVRADFEQHHHGLLDPIGYRFLAEERIAEVAVKERFVEPVEQDFGKFSAPMNRVWWRVEISPMVRTELYPAWKSAATQNRVLVIGTVLSLLTFLANAVSLFAKLKTDPQGSTFLAITLAAFCIFTWMAAEFFVAARLMS